MVKSLFNPSQQGSEFILGNALRDTPHQHPDDNTFIPQRRGFEICMIARKKSYDTAHCVSVVRHEQKMTDGYQVRFDRYMAELVDFPCCRPCSLREAIRSHDWPVALITYSIKRVVTAVRCSALGCSVQGAHEADDSFVVTARL